MDDDDEEEGKFIARSTDPGTSWAAANRAEKSRLNALFRAQLFEAGAKGKTTMDMARDTGTPRDSFSPRPSQMRKSVVAIGTKYEERNGRRIPYTIYCLKMFLPPTLPCLLGWQVLKKEDSNGHSPSTIPSGDQGSMGVGLDEPGVAEGVPPEVPVPHD